MFARHGIRSGFIAFVLLCPSAMLMAQPGDDAGGVVVDEVTPHSAAGKAGIQVGDRIVSWSRAAAPPANPQAAQGGISSPFDLTEVEVEQAPRGPVTLSGRHGDQEASWTLSGTFGLTTRPDLDAGLLADYQAGQELVKAKDVVKGTARWRAAAAGARAQGRYLEAAWWLGRAAKALADARAWPEMEAAYEEAVRGAAGDRLRRVEAQLLRAWCEVLHGRAEWARAEERYRRVQALDEADGPESLALALTIHMQASSAFRRGDLAAAERLDARALELREKLAPGSRPLSTTLINLGNSAVTRGDLTAAEGHYQRALAIHTSLLPESLDAAASLNSLGLVRLHRGDLAAAEEYFRRSLAIKEALAPVSRTVIMSLVNLGIVTLERGDLAAAEEWQQRALALAKQLEPEGLEVAHALEYLGRIAQARGDLDAAQGLYERALAIKEKLAPDSLRTATALANLAIVAHARGDRAAAEQLRRRDLAIQQRLAPEGYGMAAALFSLGELARENGQMVQAEEHLRRALVIRERLSPGSTNEALTLHQLGLVQRAAGRSEDALGFFRRALDSFESQARKLGSTEEVRSGFAGHFSTLYHDTVETLIGLGRPAEAVHVLERHRARSLLAMLAERDIPFAADLPAGLAVERRRIDTEYDGVQARIATLNPEKQGAEIQKLLGRLRELRQGQEEAAARIRQASPRFASLQYPQPLEVEQIRQELDPGTVLLAYSVGADRTFLFAVQAADVPGPGLEAFSLPVGEKGLRSQVEAFRRTVQRPAAGRTALTRQARELYDLLVRPAETQVGGSQRLVLSLDGPLHSLPFAALVRQSSRGAAQYLVEWKPLHVVPSATVYAELRKTRRLAAGAPGQLAAFGDPAYAALAKEPTGPAISPAVRELTRSFTLTPLPATRQEVDNIARRFPDRSRKYLGAEATEARAKSLGPDVRYIHFACHGYLDERLPLNSALALTIPENPAAGGDNGLLQAWEIFDQVRFDADLVTLSACNTALGKEMGGEGLLGLTRAFLYAGARSVLATLWSVSDTSTAVFMDRFYAHLAAGQSRDEALRSAQVDFIRGRVPGKGGDPSQPVRWAAHRLTGDWR